MKQAPIGIYAIVWLVISAVVGAIAWWLLRSICLAAPIGLVSGLVLTIVLIRASMPKPKGDPNNPKPPDITY